MPDNERYLKRVTPEHRRPKFLKWLETHLSLVDDLTGALKEIDSAFTLGNAVGVQLDVTGDIVGRKRLLPFEPPLGISPVLEDPLYTLLQRAKISLNQWDGTLPTAYALLEEWFPQYDFILYDNQDMTIHFYMFGEPSILEREFIARGYITPKPQGVRIRYEFILPKREREETLYIGGALVTDASRETIRMKPMENKEISGTLRYLTGMVADLSQSRISLPPMENKKISGTQGYLTGVAADLSRSRISLAPMENRQISGALGYLTGVAADICRIIIPTTKYE